MRYTRPIRIEFNHCDPAGIVFYPRYFEMTNALVENFFRDILEQPYEALMQAQKGVPTARLQSVFHAPSRLGEILEWRLEVVKLGGSSVSFRIEAWCGESHRLSIDLMQVFINERGRPAPWPPAMRARLVAFEAAA